MINPGKPGVEAAEKELNADWHRWGIDDERGALNLITTSTVLRATGLVKLGRVISLTQPVGPRTSVSPHRKETARFMNRDAGDYALGARSPGGFRFAEDTVLMSTHSGTHLDALSHAWRGDTLYNGHPAANIRSTHGAQKLGVETLGPIVTRGVLLDFVGSQEGFLPPSTPIDAAGLERAYDRAGVTPEPGDAVLCYTGWWERAGGTAEYHDNEPGLSDEGAAWLAEQDPAMVGADNYAIEVQPALYGATFPVHLRLLWGHGVPLLENLQLRELALTGISTFLFTVAPLPLQGSTASPVAPLAVL